MKKYILVFFCSVLLILPSICFAKKVTCSNGDYKATIEIDKEKFSLTESAFINVTSDTLYEVEYKTSEKNFLNIDENGIVKALKEGKVTISAEIEFLVEDTEAGSCQVSIPVEIVSNDSSLKSLTLEEFDITPLFKSDKYEYEIKLPYKFEKINIVAEPNNSNAKITGDGRRYLNEGTNEYEVVVTATDGSTSTYKIIIVREDANDDVTLESLNVEGFLLTPKFDKETYKYTLNVDKNVEEIIINAKTTYEFAKIRGTGKYLLATGTNTYKVTVTAENGNEAVYEIEIIRNNGTSSLKNLEIIDVELDSKFSSDKYTYYATVKSDVKTVDIKAEANDNDQVEIIGNEELEYGENEIIIRVTGEDKSTTTYKIIIDRLSLEEEKEIEKNDLLLKILFVMFIIAIIVMASSIIIFIKRNYKRNIKIKNLNKKRKTKNKKK